MAQSVDNNLTEPETGLIEHQVTSIADYLTRVGEIEADWSSGLPLGFHEPVMFRGHEDSEWKLMPSLYRLKTFSEVALRSEFERRAITLITEEHLPSDHWEWYFTMRHYGLPTRLLDWSTGSLIALYFAVRSCSRFQKPDHNAAVWMLSLCNINKISLGVNSLYRASRPEVSSYLSPVDSPQIQAPENPAAIVPTHGTKRIFAQRGMFTIHGTLRIPIEEIQNIRIAKLTIPTDIATQLKLDLRLAGVEETTVFPDLEGLAREINFSGVVEQFGSESSVSDV